MKKNKLMVERKYILPEILNGTTIDEVLKLFQTVKDNIPSDAKMYQDVISDSWYGPSVTTKFYWYELETDKEYENRLRLDEKYNQERIKNLEARKIQIEAELNRLDKTRGKK